MNNLELIERLKAWSRRYEPRSAERVLMSQAAEELEQSEQRVAEAAAGGLLTVETIEAKLGCKLTPAQKKRLEQKSA